MEPTTQVLMERKVATCVCETDRERETDEQTMEKSVRKRLSWNRVHTLWLCSPRITAVWIGSLLSLLIAYCFLQSWWRSVVSTKWRASQEYQRKYKSMFSLPSVCQTCKCIGDLLGCDCTCCVIRSLCKLLHRVSQYQGPQRRSWSETLNQVCKCFEPVTFYLLYEISNRHSHAVLL